MKYEVKVVWGGGPTCAYYTVDASSKIEAASKGLQEARLQLQVTEVRPN